MGWWPPAKPFIRDWNVKTILGKNSQDQKGDKIKKKLVKNAYQKITSCTFFGYYSHSGVFRYIGCVLVQ